MDADKDRRRDNRAGRAGSRILVVDDSPVVLDSVRMILEEEGHEVFTTATPLGVVNLIVRERPDLVLLDMAMPALDGDKLAELIRNHPRTRDVTLVLFSDRSTEELGERARAAGVDGYISKTFDPDELAARVAEWLDS